jgi:tRNA dimethylallyltransferase
MSSEGEYSGLNCPAIVGPTAAGKTALVTALVKRFPIEVISLDSRQIYRGLRIGTAQPTAEEQAACPHHLIDFVSPDEIYSALRFRQDFQKAFTDIKQRGGVPILAGGAGMYLTALREGFMDIPGNSPEKLKEVRATVAKWDEPALREKLKKADPKSYDRIHPNDIYRSQRAMEIYLISGKSMTELTRAQKPNPSLGLRFQAFVLQRPVAELDQRIFLRTGLMLDQGWIEETQRALQKHDPTGPGLRSIGYREIVEYLSGKIPRQELDQAIFLVTRQYAKRQRTMFRNMADSTVDHPDSPLLVDNILACLQ